MATQDFSIVLGSAPVQSQAPAGAPAPSGHPAAPAQAAPQGQAQAPVQQGQQPAQQAPQGQQPGQQGQPQPGQPGQPVVEELYGKLPMRPTMEAAEGIRFDFCEGLRIQTPEKGGPWRIVFRDMDTGVILYSQDVGPGVYVTSVKKFFVRFKLELFHTADMEAYGEKLKANPSLAEDKSLQPKPFFVHEYNAEGKEVMIQAPVPTLGDTVGWFPYCERFHKKHKCHVIAVLQPQFIEILKKQYPDMTFITKDKVPECQPYACYYLGLFFRGEVDHQPCDFRYVGLHKTAGYILGVDPSDCMPRFDLSAPRKIKEPYVCIAAQSSSQAKYWNNPFGWREVIKFLKEAGYRVLCIDRDATHGAGLVWNHIPNGAEDFTGAKPLQERIDLVKDADFFIGTSSGLSWLAWGCKVPVVMISGFTHPLNEFETPYRVINYHACNSCWNDMRCDFDHFDFLWCPRHKGDDRQFECSRLISHEQVIDAIRRIPAFQAMEKRMKGARKEKAS